MRAYGLGAYWTHFGPSGWYLDGVFQVNRFDVEAKPSNLPKLKTRGWGYTASLENGYPYEFDKNWYIEPQLQAIYSYVDLDSSDDAGAKIRFRDVDSLIGRAGVRIAKDWDTEGVDKAHDAPMRGFVRVSGMNSRGSRRPSFPRRRVTSRSSRIFRARGAK